MIRIQRRIEQARMQSRMLLQVHDELVFEAPPSETEELKRLVKAEMESVYQLSVPLLVEVSSGPNWRDAK
jgi:DNA polymerase-1